MNGRRKPGGIGRRTAIATASAGLLFPAIAARAQTTGVGLVIGNSKYHWEASLPNVRRDAPDIARRFQALGLKTELVQDASGDTMRRAIGTFTASAAGANLAALYFAGHGAAWGNDTYLVPVDADLSNPSTVKSLIPVPELHSGTAAAANRLMVFDNCRNNPADGWRQREAEDAAIRRDVGDTREVVAPNTLVLYSTAPGRIALDGPTGENSPFAAALLHQLDRPSVDLQALPAVLRRELLIATQARQILWDRNTYTQPFLLKGPAGRTAVRQTGWASDPSKIIELPNAYNHAGQVGLQLPPGLIAHRPPAGSLHAAKAGAFKFDTPSPGGPVGPAVMVVMSAEEQQSAEVVLVMRVRGQTGFRFIRPDLLGDTLDYKPRDQGASFSFKWTDANSGKVTVQPPRRRTDRPGQIVHPYTGTFTRLDG